MKIARALAEQTELKRRRDERYLARKATARAHRPRPWPSPTRQEMPMSHRFKVGQRVRIARSGAPNDDRTGEAFEVLRLMPEDQTGEPSYRIRTAARERAVRESELAAASER